MQECFWLLFGNTCAKIVERKGDVHRFRDLLRQAFGVIFPTCFSEQIRNLVDHSTKDKQQHSNHTKMEQRRFQYVPKEKQTRTPMQRPQLQSCHIFDISNTKQRQTIQVQERCFVDYDPFFIPKEEADQLLSHLLNDVDWRSSSMTTKTGDVFSLPRMQCWMSDPGVNAQLYQKEAAMEWSEPVRGLKDRLEELLHTKFDYVLMNLYRNGNDKIGYHKDDEAEEEGKNVIASVSFGATRHFLLARNDRKARNHEYDFALPHGSLVTMRGDVQKHWKHSVPQDKSITSPRVNLTFRKS